MPSEAVRMNVRRLICFAIEEDDISSLLRSFHAGTRTERGTRGRSIRRVNRAPAGSVTSSTHEAPSKASAAIAPDRSPGHAGGREGEERRFVRRRALYCRAEIDS